LENTEKNLIRDSMYNKLHS